MSIIETNFGTRLDPHRVALGSATNVTKQGAFYVFSLRVDTDDVREYSFSNRDKLCCDAKRTDFSSREKG